MENQPAGRQGSDGLKIASVVCVIVALALSWMAAACGIGYIPGMVLGAAGMALGVASVACAAIILCRKFFAFGILMIFAGLIAAGVAESACNYMVNKRGQGPPVECRKQIRIQREEG